MKTLLVSVVISFIFVSLNVFASATNTFLQSDYSDTQGRISIEQAENSVYIVRHLDPKDINLSTYILSGRVLRIHPTTVIDLVDTNGKGQFQLEITHSDKRRLAYKIKATGDMSGQLSLPQQLKLESDSETDL